MLNHIIHSAIMENGICRSTDGRLQNPSAGQVVPPVFKNGYIKHY